MREVILVVDDDSVNLILLQKILGKEYRIAAANSGMAALKYLESNTPDLILMDINMPQMSGFETIEELQRHEKWADIPVIFLTADKCEETEQECFEKGGVFIMEKPFVPDILLATVKEALSNVTKME